MRRLNLRGFAWLPTVVVLAVVVLAGSRLIYLSVQHHAAVARATAAAVAAGFAGKVEPQLQRLAALARQAPAAGEARARNTFLMTADDEVPGSPPPAAARGIASEWRAAESAAAVPAAAMLGPVRLGSEWLMAARQPAPAGGWAVAYADLDELLADSHLGRLVDMGYDFELSQVEPRSARSRSFVGSSTDLLTDAAAARIRLPVPAAIPGSYLQVAIRPRAGWYPTTLLASEIGLLAFLAWLLAFGTHDLSHALQRSRAALEAARRGLRAVNQQLAAEMQQRLKLQETFDHARFHDAFTGLPNRRFFMEQLDRALRDMRTKRRQRIAVFIVDIARFRLINDMLGHTAGDELMVQAARRFEKSMASLEVVLARWGGDQFAVLLLEAASADAALHVAELLKQELHAPIELRRHRLIVAANIGLTSVDSGQQRAEDIVREADIALSVAKRPEAPGIVAYAPNMAGQAAQLVSLEADLHLALEKQELSLLYQPIVDLRTYRMVGAEALLRWHHPVESTLAPESFLRTAEDAGLMVPITRWTILRVVKLAREWLHRLPANDKFFISVNLSPAAARDPALSEFVATQLRENQLPPSVLKFEVTEAALMGNAGAARDSLEKMRAMGIQLMLDDFGTGYSSLSYLQLFPFDFVKIDRPFVNRTNADRANTGMMAAMVQMAASLNLTAIAEIIETEAAATALKEMGCDYGQGYYFSEPIEAELALQRLRSQEPFRPAAATSDTVIVRTLDEELALGVRPQPASTAAKPRVSEADSSPTVVMRSGSLDFSMEEDE
ncbi:MAG: putative bifunctional diguanylate cyclase/phosphodiesterase [Steroidobacteraceae bacterium]